MMTKEDFAEWVTGQYEALGLTDAERALSRAQIIHIIAHTHGGIFESYKRAARELVFNPIREAREAAEAQRIEALKSRSLEVSRSMQRTPAVVAEEDAQIEAAVRAWEAEIARRERRAGRRLAA